jgi:hypothetical protein
MAKWYPVSNNYVHGRRIGAFAYEVEDSGAGE